MDLFEIIVQSLRSKVKGMLVFGMFRMASVEI